MTRRTHRNKAIRFFGWDASVKVLVVDDSAPLRERLVTLLVPVVARGDIVEAADVECAVACIRDQQPGVVILDLTLSGGTGLDVLEAIRDVTPRPRFIVLTNYAEPEVKELCLTNGADYFLDKSRDFDRVLEVVGELVSSDRA